MIEMLVVIFVVGLLSAMLANNWRKQEKQYQLQRAAQTIVQSIRKAQGFALNGSQMFWEPTNQMEVPKSYGIHFTKGNQTYFIYGDMIGNIGYQNPEDIPETYTQIEAGIQIGSLGGGTDLDVTFSIPDGFVDFFPSGTSATITIKKTGTTCPSRNCKKIIIRNTGEISIQ